MSGWAIFQAFAVLFISFLFGYWIARKDVE